MRVDDVGAPASSHVVHYVEVHLRQSFLDHLGSVEAGPRHVEPMSGNSVITHGRMKIECNDMNIVASRLKRMGELPRPVLEASSSRIKPFKDKPDFHVERITGVA